MMALPMLNKLCILATELDKLGYAEHAEQIDNLIKLLISDEDFTYITAEVKKEKNCSDCNSFSCECKNVVLPDEK